MYICKTRRLVIVKKLTRKMLAARVMGTSITVIFTSDYSSLLFPFKLFKQTIPAPRACRYGVSWTGNSWRTWNTWAVKSCKTKRNL